MKRCTKCGTNKPLSSFSKHKYGRDGLRPRCRTCCRLENDAWRKKSAKRIKAVNRAYRAKNREEHLAYNKAWNSRNRDRCDAATKRWRKRNPELVRAQKHRHRTLKRNAPGAKYATVDKILARIDYYAGRCHYCPAPADTIDHRIPLSRGGTALPANLVPACRSCNSRKRVRTEREYLLTLRK